MARHFNETTSDYLQVAAHASQHFPDGDWAVAFWINPDDIAGSFAMYVMSHGAFGAQPSFNTYIDEAGAAVPGSINPRWRDNDGTQLDNGSFGSVFSGALAAGWQHVVMQRSGTVYTCYIDGVQHWTDDLGTLDAITLTGLDLFIGGRSDLNSDRMFGGALADLAKWSRALTSQEIADLADPQSGVRAADLTTSRDYLYQLDGDASPEPEAGGGTSATVNGTTQVTGPFSAGASAALTGTAGDGATEAEIVAGGQTLILTLTGDTWVAAGATFDAQRQAIIDGLDSAQAEAAGWDAERSNIPVTAVVRTSDTVVTITLPALAGYEITAHETVTATIPAAALVTSASPIVASPTFQITAASGIASGKVLGALIGFGEF